jgi:hypothetical protein
MFQYPKKYPEAPTKNGRWIKKTVYNLPSKKIFWCQLTFTAVLPPWGKYTAVTVAHNGILGRGLRPFFVNDTGFRFDFVKREHVTTPK